MLKKLISLLKEKKKKKLFWNLEIEKTKMKELYTIFNESFSGSH